MKHSLLNFISAGLAGFLFVVLLCSCGLTDEADVVIADVNSPAVEEETLPETDTTEEPVSRIEIAGIGYSSDLTSLSIYKPGITLEELTGKLPLFPSLESLDISHTDIHSGDALNLSKQFDNIQMLWTNELLGNRYLSDVEELDLSGIPVENISDVEDSVVLFPNLKKVIMSDCGIPDEEMDELNRRHDDIQFVWTVHFSIYSLRTDTIYFCASDVPNLGNVAPELTSEQLDPLKYCTDLEALDLGHMWYKDLNFLSGMTKMKYLILVQGKFSDLSPLANMPQLEYLELFNNNKIIDLTPLLSCKNLKHLNIGYCYFLDWEPLKQMTSLERLWMPHVGIDDVGKEELAAALPSTEIYWPQDDPMGSTGGGWRENQSYYDMRDALHMFYMPSGTGMDNG